MIAVQVLAVFGAARARLAFILTEELGYVWNARWRIYEREEWLTAERLETLGGAPDSVRFPHR